MEQKNIRISRKILKKYNKELSELRDFVSKAKAILKEKLICVVLIGSRARLDFNIGSDIDLILVGNWFTDVLFNRIDEIRKKIDIPLLPIDYFLYCPDEILKFIDQGNPMILDGFIEGMVLLNNEYYQKINGIIKTKISEGYILKNKDIWQILK